MDRKMTVDEIMAELGKNSGTKASGGADLDEILKQYSSKKSESEVNAVERAVRETIPEMTYGQFAEKKAASEKAPEKASGFTLPRRNPLRVDPSAEVPEAAPQAPAVPAEERVSPAAQVSPAADPAHTPTSEYQPIHAASRVVNRLNEQGIPNGEGSVPEEMLEAPEEAEIERIPETTHPFSPIHRKKARARIQDPEKASDVDDQAQTNLEIRRKRKITDFRLKDNVVEEPGAPAAAAEEPLPGGNPPEEYNSPSDLAALRLYFGRKNNHMLIRLIATGTVAFLLLLFSLTDILSPAVQGRTAILVPMILLLISAGFSYRILINGVLSMIRFRGNCDTLTVGSLLWGLVQCGVLLAKPTAAVDFSIDIFCVIPALVFFFSTLGRMLHLKRIARGLDRLAPGEGRAPLFSASLLSRKLSSDFSQLAQLDAPIAAVATEADFLEDYLRYSDSDDRSDRLTRTLTPAVMIASIGVAVLSFLINDMNLPMAVSVGAGAFSLCVPFFAVLNQALPLWWFNRSAASENAWVSGSDTAEEFEDVDTVLVDAKELFPEGAIKLEYLQSADISRVDSAILDAASLAYRADSTLVPLFDEMLAGDTSVLRSVDDVLVEDGMGLTGWVGGHRVLLGNRILLQHHDIDVPTMEYERQLTGEGNDAVYLAIAGRIEATFVIHYRADERISSALVRLGRNSLSMLVYSTDPNLTARRIANQFGYSDKMIRLIPAKTYADYRHITKKQESLPAGMVTDGSLPSMAAGLSAAQCILRSSRLSLIIQSVGLIVGFLMVAIYGLTCSVDMGLICNPVLLLWQLVWGALSVGVILLNRP